MVVPNLDKGIDHIIDTNYENHPIFLNLESIRYSTWLEK